jgi:hypothetical protein
MIQIIKTFELFKNKLPCNLLKKFNSKFSKNLPKLKRTILCELLTYKRNIIGVLYSPTYSNPKVRNLKKKIILVF